MNTHELELSDASLTRARLCMSEMDGVLGGYVQVGNRFESYSGYQQLIKSSVELVIDNDLTEVRVHLVNKTMSTLVEIHNDVPVFVGNGTILKRVVIAVALAGNGHHVVKSIRRVIRRAVKTLGLPPKGVRRKREVVHTPRPPDTGPRLPGPRLGYYRPTS